MALVDRVQERFSTKRLAELTRPDATGSTVDTTFLAAVCDDIVGYLDGMGVGTYDETDAAILALAIDGVEALARMRVMQSDANDRRWESWEKRARSVAKTRRNDKLPPQTVKRARKFPPSASADWTPGQPSASGKLADLLDGEDLTP